MPNDTILLAALVTAFIVLGAVFYFSKQMKRMAGNMDEKTEALLSHIRLENKSQQEFSYENQNRQLIFLNDILAERERNEALRQEQGFSALRESLLAQENRIHRLEGLLAERLIANDKKMESMRETVFQSLSGIQNTVDEKLQSTISKRFGESFSLVNERLEKVYAGLGEMKSLADGVGDLKKILSNVKTRGVWGEARLRNIIQDELGPQQYYENVPTIPGAAERVEFAIRLPAGDEELLLPIDAKFPLESYVRLQNAGEDKIRHEEAKTSLQKDIIREAARISSKYIQAPHTTDFAIMYLPLESLFVQVSQIPGLLEKVQQEKRVMVTGPSTFSALLTSLQIGFKTIAIQKHSVAVFGLLNTVKQEFSIFYDLLEKAQQRIRQAGESLESASKKSLSIEKKLAAAQEMEENLPPKEVTEEYIASDGMNDGLKNV